jgi:hypothetical protein
MAKLAAAKTQSEFEASGADQIAPPSAADIAASGMVARVRWLMIISGLTTLIAIAAVVGVIGYRISRTGSSSVAATEGVIVLPKGARVIGSSISDDRLAVTLDVGGVTEIRTFDAKTLKETGRIRFATEP